MSSQALTHFTLWKPNKKNLRKKNIISVKIVDSDGNIATTKKNIKCDLI